jgi:hypothetical protein
VVGRKPTIARETLAAVSASLAMRKALPSMTQWARKLKVRPDTLRRALRDGYKHYQVEPCQSLHS